MTVLDPLDRYTTHQILKHPWISRKFQDNIPLSNSEIFVSSQKKKKFSNVNFKYLLILK